MGYFSKELQILDRNTVKYMIDQLQEDNDKLQEDNNKLQDEIVELRQKHSTEVTKLSTTIEKYRSLYGELPDE